MSENKELKTLLVATTNEGKIREIRDLVKDLPFRILYLRDCEGIEEVEETGKTFEENAALKAAGYARQTGLLTMGEDSGLSCDALEGAPGIYSARFAGTGKDDEANNQKLLKLMKTLPDNCRGAHYVSAVAIATPDKVLQVLRGEVHGIIARQPAGTGGFGYDPIFYYPPYGKTFAEVPPAEKHRVSHRGAALKKVRLFLESLLQT